jgi:(p)ppGpp synthase/HD superfamily hydrolase
MTTELKSRMLSKAILIATTAHDGQFDKGGHPYILHTLAVMYDMRSKDFDIETQCIAVLHDVLEDCPEWTPERLAEEGMSTEVITGLMLMCHTPSADYFDYIESMKHDIRVLRVKQGDLKHNMDPSRQKGLRQKDFDRMVKYQKAYALVKALIANFITIETFKKDHL